MDVQMHDGRGKNHQAYLWQYSRPAGPVVFDFRMGREREGPKRFLVNFEGILQSDGYGAYDHVGGTGIVHAACWAHARRKFFEALKVNPKDQSAIGIVAQDDSVGKTTYEGSLNVLRPFGMLVLFGQSSGPVPPIDPLLLSQKGSLFLTWPSLAHHVADAASFNNRATKVLNWVAQKSLKLRIERIYPLAEVAKAQEDLESRRTTGKLVAEIN